MFQIFSDICALQGNRSEYFKGFFVVNLWLVIPPLFFLDYYICVICNNDNYTKKINIKNQIIIPHRDCN